MTRIIQGGDRQAYVPGRKESPMERAIRLAEDVKACGRSELAELAVFFADACDHAATPRERMRHQERLQRVVVELEGASQQTPEPRYCKLKLVAEQDGSR